MVDAMGWTLLHFCWQGAAVAVALWCALGLIPARMSRARYGAACFSLALMVALPVATFARLAAEEMAAGRARRRSRGGTGCMTGWTRLRRGSRRFGWLG